MKDGSPPPAPERARLIWLRSLAWLRKYAFARSFDSEALEAAFQADCAKRFAGQRRAMTLLGAVIWVAFTYWDLKTLRMTDSAVETYRLVVGIRLFGFLYLVALLAASTGDWFERNERAASLTYAVSSFVVYALAYWQMRLMPSEAAHTYYAPALLIIISCTLASFRLSASMVTALLAACITAPSLFLWIETCFSGADLAAEQYYVWRLSNFLFATGLLSTSLGHQLERSQRVTFLRAHELAASNAAFRQQSHELQLLNQAILMSSRQSEEKAAALLELKETLRAGAEQKNREKSRFLASAVHDLRQPLQAISNSLEPALRCVAQGDSSAASPMLQLAQRAATLMAEQLAAMLEMSRLESGLVSAEIETVDLLAIAEASLAQFGESAAKEGVRLSCAKPDASVWVESDRHFLGRVLRNLIGNGIKYCDPGKNPSCEVRVKVANLPSCVRLEVEDNGIGIAAEHLADGSIFRPFHQVGNRRPQADKGVGLGLSIVSALLGLLPEHHLEVQSVPGKGTRMIVTMPHGRSDIRRAAAEGEATAAASGVRLAGVYVVVVEDDEMVNASTVRLLLAHGAIHETVNSFEAFEELLPTLERVPDLVLSDFRLPNHRTAIDVVRLARLHDERLPVLVFTGEALPPAALAALEPAVILYKPVPAIELIRKIDSTVAGSRRMAAWS